MVPIYLDHILYTTITVSNEVCLGVVQKWVVCKNVQLCLIDNPLVSTSVFTKLHKDGQNFSGQTFRWVKYFWEKIFLVV